MDAKALEQELAEHRARGLARVRRILDGPQGTELWLGGRCYLSFCSNDYLGLAADPRVCAAARRGVDRYGVGSGASHLITGHGRAHHALEEELAAFTGRPRALLFSTGYMANLGTLSALLRRGDCLLQDRLNHASLLDGGLLSGASLRRYPHRDVGVVEQRLAASHAARKLVVSDGVFSMDGDVAPIPALADVTRRHGAWLMVDDAHGIGLLGETGRGTLEHCGAGVEEVPILVGTLGKALGTFGAFVAGSELLIDYLIHFARSYVYTTALPPAVAEATRVSLRLVDAEPWRRERLRELVGRFRRGAEQLGLPLEPTATPIQPLLVGRSETAVRLSAALREDGIVVPAIRPPTVPRGRARLRLTLSALHTETQVDRLLGALERAWAAVRRSDEEGDGASSSTAGDV
jgi:8-amino-7-oxononanoate synthase